MTALTRAPAVAEERSRAQVDPVVAILGLAIIGGVAVRAIPVVPADFPLNDGGLFATMIEGLARHGLLIPAFTRYNGGTIPFAYPPLALELGAVLHLMGIATTTILQWVPFILSCLTIPAAYLALKAMIGDRMHAAVATLFFALLPRSYLWVISGGGITRSLGLLLALLALWRLARYTKSGRRLHAVQGGVLAGLAATSHLEAALLITTGALILLARGRDWRKAGWLLAAGCVAAVVASPWIASVVVNHGLAPFESASSSRWTFYPIATLQLLGLRFTEETYFALGSLLGIVGLVQALLSRTLWPFAWLLLIFIVIPGGAPTYAMLPWSVFVGIAVLDVIGPRLSPARRPIALGSAAAVVFVSSVWTSQAPLTTLRVLSPETRAAMESVSSYGGASRYLLVTGSPWPLDATSEWFPYLTGKVSVATVQAYEFSGAQAWTNRIDMYSQVQACATEGVDCVLQQLDKLHLDAVFIPKGPQGGSTRDDCCAALRTELRQSPRFVMIYDGPGATIGLVAR